MGTRYFTVAEANELIPWLEGSLRHHGVVEWASVELYRQLVSDTRTAFATIRDRRDQAPNATPSVSGADRSACHRQSEMSPVREGSR